MGLLHVIAAVPSLEQVLKAEEHSFNLSLSYWRANNFLTFQWWLLILLSIVPAVVWWIFVDKKRLFEIVTFGLIIGTIASILDSIGTNAMLWTYPIRVTPYMYPQFYPFNLALLIVPYMFIYQWSAHKGKKFFLYVVMLSALFAFVGETLLEWLGIYRAFTWNHWYSFPIYIVLGMICRWIVLFVKQRYVIK